MSSRFHNIIAFLNEPYPDTDDVWTNVKTAFYAGLAVFFVLAAYQPFNIGGTGSELFKYCFIFGCITIVVSLLVYFLYSQVLRINRESPTWTFWKWLLSVGVIIFFIAIANYAFMIQFNMAHLNFNFFLQVFVGTILVGVFPTLIFGSINLVSRLKANQSLANQNSIPHKRQNNEAYISLNARSSSQFIELAIDNICYIESMQNYVKINTADGDIIDQKVLRNTIAYVDEKLLTSSIIRCHRSFMVNTNKISKITGNAQGLRLTLDQSNCPDIPVSRKYIKLFRD